MGKHSSQRILEGLRSLNGLEKEGEVHGFRLHIKMEYISTTFTKLVSNLKIISDNQNVPS